MVAIDRMPERLNVAREHGEAEIIETEDEDAHDRPMEMTRPCSAVRECFDQREERGESRTYD